MERRRAVLVGWDTLDERTYRHDALAAYQSGRECGSLLLLTEARGPCDRGKR
jgi:hypothetical protein